jgi:hypothetical protein
MVFAILCALAAFTLPMVGHHQKPLVARAYYEMSEIEQAILAYKADYNNFPMTAEARQQDKADFTYGTFGVDGEFTFQIANPRPSYQANNAEVIAILTARNHPRFNKDHVNNPLKKEYLKPRIAEQDGKPGLGPNDGVYRDPWGNPYIISLDLDGDGWTRDAFYCVATVAQATPLKSSSLLGLKSPSSSGANDFAFQAPMMIWSLGADGQADPKLRANEGVNRDNILRWRR